MLKEICSGRPSEGLCVVLILILMEHAQRDWTWSPDFEYIDDVLILILMEHAQRV